MSVVELDTGTELVLARIEDGVGVLTLNRPARLNALHPEMHDAVPVVLDRFLASPDVGSILLTGNGRAFSAGGDVRGGGSSRRRSGGSAGADDRAGGAAPEGAVGAAERAGAGRAPDGPVRPSGLAESQGYLLARTTRMIEVLYGSPKVVLAALPGPAVGAGMAMALAADLRIAAASASFAPGWGRLGFSGDFGGPWLLTRLLGPARALEMLLEDRTLDAEAAFALGLVNRVVPDEELAGAAFGWARSIAARPLLANAYFKANVRQAAHLPLSEAITLESERMARLALTEDHRQAVRRWFEEAAAKRAERGPEPPQR